MRFAATNLILGTLLAFVLGWTDYHFADIYRQFASTFHKTYPSHKPAWFAGEWGFRAYLEKDGAQELGRRDVRPQVGDVIAVPSLATPYETLFDDNLRLESLTLLAPSRVRFSIPPIGRHSRLAFSVGMPLVEESDGVTLEIGFEANGVRSAIYSERILHSKERRWTERQISLEDFAGKSGDIVFSAGVGESGNADADWISLARARICEQTDAGQIPSYDFHHHLHDARIEPVENLQYHTKNNVPMLSMAVTLEQESALALRKEYSYRSRLPLRLLDEQVHAGFWSMNWGMLPFSFVGDAYLETIRVFEVTRQINGCGETTPAWYAAQ